VRLHYGPIILVWVVLCAAPAGVAAQPPATAAAQLTSTFTVTVPNESAELVVDGKPVPGNGLTRQFDVPVPQNNATHESTITVTWNPNTYTTMTRTRVVSFRPGEPVTVDLNVSDPSDRVRVIYVPTPEDIVQEMIKLAGITSDDVVFEPGCGDARITIAAVKAGAKRGVGIDIDPDRVADSKAAVEAAGLSDRIEIRLGDALEIPDLSDATVVFLYMGDHFNLLIRPLLWKHLPVGARVVSHRFKMGEWEPDKTVNIDSYELHLWTITEDVKRKAQ
jgi:uncharacterized protein (TIGR03000 family)